MEFSISTGIVRSPVDPAKQLDYSSVKNLLLERIRQAEERERMRIQRLKQEREKKLKEKGKNIFEEFALLTGRNFSIFNEFISAVAGMPSHEEVFWEYVCPGCDNRTIHSVNVISQYKEMEMDNCLGGRYEQLRTHLMSFDWLDLELTPIGFCSHCAPNQSAELRLVVRFPGLKGQPIKPLVGYPFIALSRLLQTDEDNAMNAFNWREIAKWLNIDLDEGNKV